MTDSNTNNPEKGDRQSGPKPQRHGQGQRKPRTPHRDGDERRPRRDGDWKPKRDGEGRPRREGDWKPRRDGEGRPRRDGDWKPRRDDERKPRRDGDWKPKRDDDRRPRRDGDRRPQRDDARKPRREHNTERERSFGPRDRKYRGGEGRERSFAETDGNNFRPVRGAHTDPEVPEHLTPKDLHPAARNELKTLEKQHAEFVALHLAAVAHFIDEDPERAHQHAISAMRRAPRIPVTRETYAITSYITQDFATARRELRTYRRLTGSNVHLALLIDSERALNRPEKGIEEAREANLAELPAEVQVQVAIALSGARLDMGQTQQALFELEIPQLDPNRAYSWSPELFAAYAAVLEDLGREEEARSWRKRAFAAEDALHEHHSGGAMEIFEIEEIAGPDEAAGEEEDN